MDERMGVGPAISDGVIPPLKDPREYPARFAAYNASDKGKARARTRQDKRNAECLNRYLTKQFVAWDGEGGNNSDGSHTYFLLASSTGVDLSNRDGLPTRDIFDAFLGQPRGVTNIVYSGNYDVNMILSDLPRKTLTELYREGRVSWEGYWMEWRPHKSFELRRRQHIFRLYDIFPFFQTSFVKALDGYFGENWPYRDEIIREKARRGNFEWEEIHDIRAYNRAELANTVHLADELRTRLYRADLRVTRWDGPGAVASALYKKQQTKPHIGLPPEAVILAGRRAYAGGRFEIIRQGHSVAGAYQYDIRSAYPSAMRELPCLNPEHGRWTHRELFNGGGAIKSTRKFGLYRIEVVNPWPVSRTQPQPLWMRNKDGTIYYEDYSHGWYWTPEAELAMELGGINVYEAWEWEPNCACEPFSFVEPLYNKRAALKRAGDGAHVGLKLGLNSLYGKLAQQIGWDPGPPLRLPPFHSLEWAGYITSHCRALMYRAAMLSIDDVISFETDAIFSRVPLDLPLNGYLGGYEETKFSSLTYLQSGFYFGTTEDGREISKSRGFNKDTVTRADVIKALQSPTQETIPAEQTRFVGLGAALQRDMKQWRHWVTAPRDIRVRLPGKRINVYDGRDERKVTGDGWTETVTNWTETTFSYPYAIAWADPDPDMANPDGLSIDEVRKLQAAEYGLGYE